MYISYVSCDVYLNSIQLCVFGF